jgi:HSP20 family protein
LREVDMFPVPVPTTRPTSREALDEVIEKLDSVFNDIRRKAFDSFLRRGEKFGSELEDWFKAERELFALPDSEMKETNEQFEIKAAVPGFAADDLHVQVLPELIVIEGESSKPLEAKETATEGEKVVFSDFVTKRVFRQYKLSAPVLVDDVSATLNNGVLTITAPKTKALEQSKAIEVPIHTELVKAGPVALATTASK